VALYDTEQSNDCRLVRERITELDLAVETIIPAAPNSRAVTDDSYEYYLEGATKEIPRMVVVDEQGKKVFVGSDDVLGYFTDVFGPRAPVVDDTEEELKKKVVEVLLLLGENLASLLRYGRGGAVADCAKSPDTPRPSKPLVSVSLD